MGFMMHLYAAPWLKTARRVLVLLFLVFSLTFVGSQESAASLPQSISVEASSGLVVCNVSGAVSQIPGQPDYFVGRGIGIGTLDYCHNPTDHPIPFIALYKMDWIQHRLIMQNYLLRPPVKTPSGIIVSKAYDPFVVQFRNELWVAFECTVPGAVSTCVAPLAPDLKRLDLSRLSVPVLGTLGPHGANHQIVGLVSASAPTLLAYKDKLYLYWQVDPYENALPENVLVTRGMALDEDAQGRLWGDGANAKPVQTDDARLTVLVHDVDLNDKTGNHVALTSDVIVVGDKLLEIASIGGTAGPEVCRSTHDKGNGCWRFSLSVASVPLGPNVFGQNPLPSADLPDNVVEYPRIIVDPSGKHLLLGLFEPPKMPPLPDRAPPIATAGLVYIPFEPSDYINASK